MAEPTVSVVIPTYQSASYLPDAVCSALAQTVAPREIEIVVVDDGSTDDVSAALAPFGERLRLVRIAHSGLPAARNAGIEVSRGKYVAFLDADDLWLPRRLEALLVLATTERDALLSTDLYHEIAGQRSPAGRYASLNLLHLFEVTARQQYAAALRENFATYMQLVPRHLFDRVGVFDPTLSFGEDYDLWLRFLEAGIPLRVVPEPLAIYRYMRPGAITAVPSVRKAEDRLRILERHRRDVPKWRLREATGYVHHLRLRQALRNRDFLSAARASCALALNAPYVRNWARTRRAHLSTG
jgi:glycosyltransferase involved in cell wall biosynthesis